VLPFFLTGCGLKKNPAVTTKTTPSPVTGTIADTASPEPGAVAAGTTLLTIDPNSLTASLNDHLNQADTKAKAWRTNAALTHISVKVPASYAIGAATETYTYGSENDGFNWWTVTISEKTNKIVRALIPKEDFLGTGYTAIPKQFWKINYVEALQLADVNGGADFRSTHPDAETVISLAVNGPKNYLWWMVEYKSGTTVYHLYVNPASKEVVDEQGKSMTAVAGSATQATATPTAASTTTSATPTPSDIEVLEE
jgi:hypothetical protein